jgi:hypothetical protein
MRPYFDKADPWSSHSEIKRRITRLRAGIKILDVGMATGTQPKQVLLEREVGHRYHAG